MVLAASVSTTHADETKMLAILCKTQPNDEDTVNLTQNVHIEGQVLI